MTDPSSWDNIAHHSEGSATEARTRLHHVLDNDPFARMFSPEIRACMIDGFLLAMGARKFVEAEDAIRAYDHKSIRQDAKRAMSHMPLGFTTDDFRDHIIHLVTYAIMPKPEYDEFHRAI